MREKVRKLWPEIDWIADAALREKVLATWVKAFELSPLTPEDLHEIPFTLLVPNRTVTFMEHKRCVVHIARRASWSATRSGRWISETRSGWCGSTSFRWGSRTSTPSYPSIPS